MLAAPRRSVAPAPLRRSRVASTTLERRRQPTGGLAQVDAVGDVVRRRGTDASGVADDAGEPEDPLLAAVGVEPHDVPAAGVADHAPRLEVALELRAPG